MKLHRILAPTDFSRSSGFALEWAANLAEALRAAADHVSGEVDA